MTHAFGADEKAFRDDLTARARQAQGVAGTSTDVAARAVLRVLAELIPHARIANPDRFRCAPHDSLLVAARSAPGALTDSSAEQPWRAGHYPRLAPGDVYILGNPIGTAGIILSTFKAGPMGAVTMYGREHRVLERIFYPMPERGRFTVYPASSPPPAGGAISGIANLSHRKPGAIAQVVRPVTHLVNTWKLYQAHA